MNLNVTDPAILFPGISLLFLAYTNRYLALAGVIRQLNSILDQVDDDNRKNQIASLGKRITMIKYMQACGVLAFIACICSMAALLLAHQRIGEFAFGLSLLFMALSLFIAFTEIMMSGTSLRIELQRPHPQTASNNDSQKT